MSKQHYSLETYSARGSIGYLVKRSHSLMLDNVEPMLEAHGFSMVQYTVLAWLREGITVNPREICLMYRHDSGAMTRLIDQLAERGLLERMRGERDRRKIDLKLTDAGRAAADMLVPLVLEKVNQVLGDFSDEEFRELTRLLLKLNLNLQTSVDAVARAE